VDIQEKLDEVLASNPDMQQYVEKLWYVPEGTAPPPGTTHVLRLASAVAPERHLTVGVVATPKLAVILDLLLAMVATQSPHQAGQ
jgi:hypothetical protein